jgi:hypothetical protein
MRDHFSVFSPSTGPATRKEPTNPWGMH